MAKKFTKYFSKFGLGQVGGNLEITESMRNTLGGKGAGLAVMSNMGFNIPPGVTISTEVSEIFSSIFDDCFDDAIVFVEGLAIATQNEVMPIEDHFGYAPMYAVRSGAPVSMPGMMDTVLNVGIHRGNIDEWVKRIGERAAWDCYTRLLMTIATSIFEISDKQISEIEISVGKFKYGAKSKPESYADFNAKHLMKFADKLEKHLDKETPYYLSAFFNKIVGSKKKVSFSDFINGKNCVHNQLCLTIMTVLRSWSSDRAKTYREINNLQHVKGTAINIQSMVFGNFNNASCSGVLFTRNPTTGESVMTGEYLVNAQGEDVVAGNRTPNNIEEMKLEMPNVYKELVEESQRMEELFKDMMDIEFTVQDGELFFLQSRAGKRSTQAKFIIALDFYSKNILDKNELKERIKIKDLEKLVMPSVTAETQKNSFTKGTPASGGVVKGIVCLSSDKAVEMANKGKNVILFAFTTTPDDIAGINASVGIVTQIGGVTSHAAVVARGMDKTCIVGVPDMDHEGDAVSFHDADVRLKEGQEVVIDGSSGTVYFADQVEIEDGKMPEGVANLIYRDIEKSNGFYFNINDPYLDSIDIEKIRGKMYIKVKPHHISENIVDMIESVADKVGRKHLVLDISSLAQEDFVDKTVASSILQINGIRSYNKQNLLRFSNYMDDFAKKTQKHSVVTVVSGNKKINYNIDPKRKSDKVDIDVQLTQPVELEHFENIIFT
jgi:pyruvate,orthophosphate dikinase